MNRNSVIASFLLLSMPLSFQAVAAHSEESKLAACFDLRIGKDRLFCYRAWMEAFPPASPSFLEVGIEHCKAKRSGRQELTCLDELFGYPRPGLD